MYKNFSLSIISLIMLFSAFFFSCNKSSDAGINLVPKDYLIKTMAQDTFTVVAHTLRVDSIITSNATKGLLGSYLDPIFGEFKASFITEISPSLTPDFGTNPYIDSAVLYLRYDTIFGNKSVVQELNISEITDRIRIDSSYYQNFDIKTLNPISVLNTTFKPINDYNRDSLLTIKLPRELAVKLFDVATWSDTTFSTYFKGFLISSNSKAIDASIASFNLFHTKTRLSLFYHNSIDTLEFKFTINSNTCAHINLFDQKHNSSNFLPDLNNLNPPEDSVVYLQGGGGLKVKIQFPYLDKLKEQGVWGVNRAELVIKANPSTISTQNIFPAPKIVVLYSINDLGKQELLTEYYTSSDYLGALYNNDQYVFDITYVAQKILTGKQNNNGFILMLKDANTNPTRIVLTSGKHSSPMKLALTLTKLSEK
jgi:hypothetical protein